MSSQSTPAQLNIIRLEQEQSQWCWAACGAMVYQGVKKKVIQQCVIANGYFQIIGRQQNTCINPDSYNYGCPPDTISNVYALQGISSQLIVGYPPQTLVFNEIAIEKRPILAMLKYTNGSGHILVISGVSYDPQFGELHIYAIDSRKGYSSGWIPYTSLLTAWGYGTWIYSWVNIV